MTAGAFLELLRTLPMTTPLAFTGGEPFVVLSPHPDDESLGVGGLIAAAGAAHIVMLTDGAGSHPNSAQYPAERLIALRKAEAAVAAERLGVPARRLTFLDLPDARVPTEGAAFERAVDHLAAVVEATGARMLLVTWEHDPHCDHAAAAAMARALRSRQPDLALWFYPIWGWHLDPNTPIDAPAPVGFRLDIGPWLDAKHSAIAAHESQMTDLIADDPAGFRFSATTLAPFLAPVETVFEVP